MPELRKDIITREWVILAKERAKRPSDFLGGERAMPDGPEHDPKCPFCPGNEALTPPEIFTDRPAHLPANGPGWQVRVIPNKFAALQSIGDLNREDYGIYEVMDGVGAHEVVVESPLHNQSIGQMEAAQVESVIRAYIARFNALRQDPRLRYILVFRNHGKVAGSSLTHPHSQIVATPIIPQKVWGKIKGVEQYREYREKCPYCDTLDYELKVRRRIIVENDSFVACTPYASRSPFECRIMPRKHQPCYSRMTPGEVTEFAQILREVLGRLYSRLNNPPYNFTLLGIPCGPERTYDFHWHMEIVPRLTTPAGLEMGTSIYINVTSPEEAAQFLRDASCPSPSYESAARS
ncbi:MAG: galactose-1-phosphate uridylyltransferase [candidate division NC10 bacterium]|nr:galactose-1-phosphate uridylyltransferase [candidate division NC10 bacterium]